MEDQRQAHKPSTDGAAIRELYEDLLEDWARGDGKSYGSRFTENADYVVFDGTHKKGREEIDSFHQQAFDTFLKGSRLMGRIESTRFLSPDVALIHATADTIMRGETEPAPGRESVQTFVAVRSDEAWRFTAFQNTRIQPTH